MHPRTHQAKLQSTTSVSCFVENAIEYQWVKVGSDRLDPNLEKIKTNTLQFTNFEATDQGTYICVGIGGGEYQTQMVRSRPAVLTAQGE